MIKSFQDLQAYKNSKALFPTIVETTQRFPREGRYLREQMCRAANSIHANIAEGFGRSEAEFKKYLTTSLGSNNEMLSHLEDALLAGYIDKKKHDSLVDGYNTVGKQIFQLRAKWRVF